MNKHIIFHIDANYFFARCEEIKDPKLELIPFVVCSNHKRGVVATSNLLARQYGIKAGSKLNRFIDNKAIKIVEPHHHDYAKFSQKLFDCIQQFLHLDIEPSSIDECYVDVTDIINDYHDNYLLLATELKNYIFQQTKLFVSIGIGENKFLAKMANEIKNKSNITTLFKQDIKTKLWPLKIDQIYMVGKKTAELLHNLNIHYVTDFLNYPDQAELQKLLQSKYFLIKNFCHGIDYSVVNVNHELPKSISSGQTFINNTSNEKFILKQIHILFNDIYHQLMRDNLSPLTISVHLKYNYTTHKSKAKTFQQYNNDESFLLNQFLGLFYQLWENQEIRAITLTVSNLKPNNEIHYQTSLNLN